MAAFAYFRIQPGLLLPDNWIAWLGRALAGHPRPLDPLRLPQGFDSLLDRLARHGILPLLYTRLRDGNAWEALPPPVASSLMAAFRESAARALLLERELGRIGAAYPGLGLLKGAALGATIYANPALRPASDIDLLVRPHEVDQATRGLARVGYEGIGAVASPVVGKMARRFRAQLPLLRDAPGLPNMLVELHWSLVEVPFYVNSIPPDEAWAGAARHIAPPFIVPRPAVLLAHAAAHLAMHHSCDLRLIWLVDVDRLARWPAMDWDDVVRLGEGWRLGLALRAALADAGGWLGTPAPKEVTEALERLSTDRIARQCWGLGDATAGRALRRAAASLVTMPPGPALRYAGWLAGRAALRPVEWWMLGRHGQTL